MKSTLKDFQKDHLNKDLKNTLIKLTRIVSKIGSYNTKFYETCFCKLDKYADTWDRVMDDLLEYKIHDKMANLGDLPPLDVDEENEKRENYILSCNQFGKLIGPQFVPESKSPKFGLGDSDKIDQFTQELEKLKTPDQDIQSLCKYIDTVNQDNENKHKILHSQQGLVVDQITDKQNSRTLYSYYFWY